MLIYSKLHSKSCDYLYKHSLFILCCQFEVSEPWHQLVNVVDFALALRDKLESINQECFNQFVLRVGECLPDMLEYISQNVHNTKIFISLFKGVANGPSKTLGLAKF